MVSTASRGAFGAASASLVPRALTTRYSGPSIAKCDAIDVFNQIALSVMPAYHFSIPSTNTRKQAMSLINTQVQPFKTEAFHNGKFVTVTEQSLKGKWSVLIFMPAAFTFNCPTEVEDAADNYAEFQKAGAEVYIVTTDTHFSHKVW